MSAVNNAIVFAFTSRPAARQALQYLANRSILSRITPCAHRQPTTKIELHVPRGMTCQQAILCLSRALPPDTEVYAA